MSAKRTRTELQDAEWERIAQRYIFRFRGPILFEEAAVRELCRLARQGYETSFKKETYGFLFGSLDRSRRFTVRRSCFYRGGNRTRTGVTFKDWPTLIRLARRRRELAREMRMRFGGSFHSHVEIAGDVFKGLSEPDRESFRTDPMATLEVVVFIWEGKSRRAEHSPRDIVAFEPMSRYNYRIRCHTKRASGIRQVTLKVVSSDIVVVY